MKVDINDINTWKNIDTEINGWLMHKNIPLIRVSQKNFEYNKEKIGLFPLVLRTPKLQFSMVKDWLKDRALPLSRSNAKNLLNALQLSQIDKMPSIYYSKALSLTDCFWLKLDKNKNDTWERVNLFENKISESLAEIAFNGSTLISLQGHLRTPELTGQGVYPKCWRRVNGKIYLYKGNTLNGREVESEVVASDIIDILKFDHVKYTLATLGSKPASKCELMTNQNISISPIEHFNTFCIRVGTSLEEQIIKQKWDREYFQMILLDYIINNIDRHSANWGVYINNNTGKVTGLHPLFDHNNSFGDDKTNTTKSIVVNGMSLAEAGKYSYIKLNKPDCVKSLRDWIKSKNGNKSFKIFNDGGKRMQETIYRIESLVR